MRATKRKPCGATFAAATASANVLTASVLHSSRQTAGASGRVGERVVGTKGVSNCCGLITDHKGKEIWRFSGEDPNPYGQEHADLIASIRGGKHLNEATRVAESTMTAIMGRLSAYTGRELQLSWAMRASKLDLVPGDLTFGSKPVDPVAKPGTTMLT